MAGGNATRSFDSVNENKVGIVIRALGGSVRKDFLAKLKSINDGESELDMIDWLWLVNNFFDDDNLKSIFNEVILKMEVNHYDINNNKAFKDAFLRFAIQEFSRKVGGFSQVVQLAILDEHIKSKGEEFILELLDAE